MTMAESGVCCKHMVIIVKLVCVMHVNTMVYITIVTETLLIVIQKPIGQQIGGIHVVPMMAISSSQLITGQ